MAEYRLEREVEGIETVGALKEALSGMADDLPISDGFGDALLIAVHRDMETGELTAEIR